MRLTAPQIATYARHAGFRGVNVAIAVAVALAESGGITDRVSPTNKDGSHDYGLWQINSVHSDLLSTGRWSNPADNARMAYAIHHSQGWAPWTTYNSGAYLTHLAEGNRAANTTAAVKSPGPGLKISNKWATPRVWYSFYSIPILPPPRRLVTYKRATKDIPGLANRTLPKGAYVVTPTALANNAVGKPSTDPVKIQMRTFLQFYWGGKYTEVLGKHDDAWLFTYTVAEQPKQAFDPKGTPDPGEAIPGPGPGIGNPLKFLGDLIAFITDPHNWFRLALFIVGAALVLFAAYKLANVKLPSAVAKAAEIGAVA